MLFTLIILVTLAAIVFFHYLEGFFSATLSAIFAAVAALVAVSYHEWIVNALLAGRFADEADATVLMLLFAVVYLVLKLTFDQLIKGNVRVPVLVDKIGAAVMGLVAGIFALGVVVLAAQELPFGPTIAGYSRFAVVDRTLPQFHVSGFSQMQIPTDSDELAANQVGQFDTNASPARSLFVDSFLLNTVSAVSQGSLAADPPRPLTSIHPDWLTELFGDRLGYEISSKHSALNLPSGPQQVNVNAVYSYTVPETTPPGAEVKDQYDPMMRKDRLTKEISALANLPKSKMLLVVRMQVSADAGDTDNYFRFGPGTIRLVAPTTASAADPSPMGDYYPVGTLEGSKLFVDRLDDYLFLPTDHSVDLVFEIDRAGAWGEGKTIPAGSFLEVKRLAQVDLGGHAIADAAPPPPKSGNPPKVGVLHVSTGATAEPAPPPTGYKPPTTKPAGEPGQGSHPTSGNPLNPQGVAGGSDVLNLNHQAVVSSALNLPISLSAGEAKKPRDSAVAGGTTRLRDGKARSLSITTWPSAADLENHGDVKVTDFSPPSGKVLVQIAAEPVGDNTWAWASHVKSLSIVDASGNSYSPQGVWVNATIAANTHVMAQYDAGYPLGDITPGSGQVTLVVFYVEVPKGTVLKQVMLDGKPAKDLTGLDTSH